MPAVSIVVANIPESAAASISATPLVSIVLPTRNRSRLLQRSVSSVLAQSHRNLELIVVDDGSTDSTQEMLAEIRDSRLRVLRRTQNHGAAAARNAGVDAAQGELIAFQDDDDMWLVQKLEKQVGALMNAPAGVAWCLCAYIRMSPRRSVYIGGNFYWTQLDYQQGTGGDGPDYSLIATPGWLARRDALRRAGLFDERIGSWDDWEFGLRMFDQSVPVYVDEPLFIQDHIEGSALMRNEHVRANDLRIIMEKHGHRWANNPKTLARHYYQIGRIETLFDPPPAGRANLLKSLRLRPLFFKSWAALLMSYLGRRVSRAITTQIRRLRVVLH